MNAIYEATTIVVSTYENPMKHHLWFETLEQLDKNIIFIKACIILEKKIR